MCRRTLSFVCWVCLCPVAFAAEPVASSALDVPAELRSIKEQLSKLSSNLTQVVGQLSERDAEISKLKEDLKAVTDQINEELTKQQQILAAISQPDSAGRQVIRLSANMESPEFRQDLRDAVHDSLDTTGTLRVANKTGDYQRIFINRTEHGVAAGQTVTLKVPVGTVSTQLPGRDLKNWTVAAPTYEQNIDIVPDPVPTTTYVARPVYYSYSAPVYYDPLPVVNNAVYYWP